MVEEGDLRSDRCGEADLMRHDQHRHAALREPAHHVQDLARQFRVERGGRLVEEHDAGIERQRAGDRHTLLLTAGKLARIMPGAVAEADRIEFLPRPILRLRPAHAAHRHQRLRDIAERGHMRPEVELLEHHADPAPYLADLPGGELHATALRGPVEAERISVDRDIAVRRLLQEGDAAEQRALARARRPDQAGDLPLRHVEIDPVEHPRGAEILGKPFDANGGCVDIHAANLYLESRASARRPSAPQISTSAQ